MKGGAIRPFVLPIEMNVALHFAIVFGICMATFVAAYVFVVFRWGFNVGIAWGTSHPPMWAVQIVFLALAGGPRVADCCFLGNFAAD